MAYTIFKALHIIFMVSYFAGIFYLVRIFVYYKDTDEFEVNKKKILREQYVFMLRRLWNIIIFPAAVLMCAFGIILILLNPTLLQISWFHLKLTFLIGLAVYHFWCWKKIAEIKELHGESLKNSNIQLRQSNEIATFLLFIIVFTVVLKFYVIMYWWQFLVSFFVLVAFITTIVKLVNKKNKP